MKEHGIRRDPRYRLHRAETLAEGSLVTLSRESIRLPNGHETVHDRIHLPDAVAVVALDADGRGARSVVLVEQFRNSVQGYIHEIPAGIVEQGEEPEACARRELEEETGFRPGRVQPLGSLLMIPGTSGHRLHFFIAEALAPGEQRLEDAECLRVRRVPFEPLVEKLVEGPPGSTVIVDAKTHLGILHAWALIRRREGKDR